MTSKTDICNLALLRLGQGQISNITELSPAGVACSTLYDLSRRAVLAMHPWRFAQKEVTLAVKAETPDSYAYSYLIPSDCITVVGISPFHSVPPIEFETFGNAIWTNTAEADARYIWDIEDCNKFTPLFVSALAWYLAADLVPTITGKLDQQSAMLQGFGAALRSAGGANGNAAKQPSRTGQDIKNSRI